MIRVSPNLLEGFFNTIQCSFITQALRQKNWKAMEALSEAEKTAQAQINKALEAAKVVMTFCQ